MKANATIRLRFSSERQLNVFVDSLAPEISKPIARRAIAELKHQKNFLILHVAARDTVALRSTLNAYLRWISSIVNVVNVLEQSY